MNLLPDTGKKVEEVDARALRQLELCLRVRAKIASGVYPSPPPGTLSGPVRSGVQTWRQTGERTCRSSDV